MQSVLPLRVETQCNSQLRSWHGNGRHGVDGDNNNHHTKCYRYKEVNDVMRGRPDCPQSRFCITDSQFIY